MGDEAALQADRLGRMKTAFVSPFTNHTNDYINRVKTIVAACGYDVQPLSFRTLLSRRVLGLFQRDNVVLLHWLEARAFSEGHAGASIRWAGLAQFAVYALVLSLMRARLVYFVHDHAVHDLSGWRRGFSVWLIRLLSRLADVRVVHDPSFADRYRADYLPHPLYRDGSLDELLVRGRTAPGPMRAGILGAVRPYKRIERIIDLWPVGPELAIRGRADPAYEALLRTHMARRDPAPDIRLSTGFMSREDFAAALARLDVLILPHADESALVSGAFFEAIGAVPIVIARTSPFIRWVQGQFEGVLSFDTDEEFVAAVQQAQALQARMAERLPVSARRAEELFGLGTCVARYKQAIERP